MPFVAKRQRGLTLVEVLIAATLGLVVLTVMVQSLVPTMVASRKAADRVDLHQRAVLLGDRIAQDLRSSARVGVGLSTPADRTVVSIHPRRQDTGQVEWLDTLRIYDWQAQEETIRGYIASPSPAPLGPLVPALLTLDGLPKQETLRVRGVKAFSVGLDSGPAVRLFLTLGKGETERLEFRRSVLLRNGAN